MSNKDGSELADTTEQETSGKGDDWPDQVSVQDRMPERKGTSSRRFAEEETEEKV